ncbi:putative 60S ribosomal protein L7-4 [Blattamonas nauphoetae]|uniref:60S ribosomal protein L7-4 n=1 Tax=Blattamonas nauphoetae TaxID=2049346 RepID=A0ABQ9YFS7_9EUKA|nr:putative 60S ribosomal protein L7-4 [Blattamonas nauphoetae]
MPKHGKTKLPTVPEVRLQKRKVLDQKIALDALKRKPTKKPKEYFFHAEDFVKKRRQTERSRVHQKKIKKNIPKVKKQTNKNDRIVFVVLVHRVNRGLDKEIRTILKTLRLRRAGQGIFLELTPRNRVLLKKIEPFVTFGTIKPETVRELLQKRGQGRTSNGIQPLTDNKLIEEYFQQQDDYDGSLLCLDDLSTEITSVGPHFEQVVNFLTPFKVTKAAHWEKVNARLYQDGGQRGDRGSDMDAFVRRFLG